MPGKTFSVTTRVVDQATAPLRAVEAAIGGLGRSTSGSATTVVGAATRMIGSFLRLATTGALVGGVIASVSFTAVVAGLRSASSEAEQFARRARRIRVGTEFLRELGFVAQQSGVGVEAMTSALEGARANLLEFGRTGSGSAAESIARLGLRTRDATGHLRSLEELLPEIADGIASIGDEAEQRRLTSGIFGADNQSLVDLLAGGSDAIAKLRGQYRALGDTLTEEQNRALEGLAKSFRLLGVAATRGRSELAASLAPIATDVTDSLSAAFVAIPKVISRVTDLIRNALRSDAIGEEAKAALREIGVQLSHIVGVVAREVVLFGLSVAQETFQVGLDALGPNITKSLLDVFVTGTRAVFQGISSALQSALNLFGLADDASGEVQKFTDDIRYQATEGAKEAKDYNNVVVGQFFGPQVLDPLTGRVKTARELLRTALAGVGDLRGAAADSAKPIGDAVGELLDTLEGRLGVVSLYTDALRRVRGASDEAGAAVRKFGEAIPDTQLFFDGFRAGVTALNKELSNAFQQGVQFAQQFADTLSSSLADAFAQSVTGAESFDKAVRQLGTNVLRILADLTTRLAVVRILAAALGIGSAAAGPGAGAVLASEAGGFQPTIVQPPAFAAGAVFRGALEPIAQAADGLVLQPRRGGRLVRAAEAGDPEAIMPLVRGRSGRLGVEASGAGAAPVSLSLAVNVNMTGAPASDTEAQRRGEIVGREAATQLLDVIRRNPTLRASFR
ncbi:MAG: phage tail tape measure protein, partial [Phycisphaerae bacterium]